MERRVVIIEDERDVARLLEFNLRGAGFGVICAGTGGDGLAAAVRMQRHARCRRPETAEHRCRMKPPVYGFQSPSCHADHCHRLIANGHGTEEVRLRYADVSADGQRGGNNGGAGMTQRCVVGVVELVAV